MQIKSLPRYTVGRVNISEVNMRLALECINSHMKSNKAEYICVTNTRAVSIYAKKWDYYRDIQNNSLLSVPDGMPLVWIARSQGLKDVERVTGYAIMMNIFKKGYSHYFLGDTEETLSRLKSKLVEDYPLTKFAGSYSPPFRQLTDYEVKEIATDINRLNPDFIWVGLGAPKQEYFMVRIKPYLNRGIIVGVGAAFRLITGEYKLANHFLQKMGLEGFFWRIRTSPMRIVKMYPIMIPFILRCIIISWFRRISSIFY